METVEYDLAAFAGAALLRDDYVGQAKLVIDRATDTLVGATFVGPGSPSSCTRRPSPSSARSPSTTLWHAVPCYPTVSEIWLRLLETLRGQRGTARDGG